MHRLSPCSLEAAALALGPDAVDVDADAADASGIPLFQYMLQGSSSASLFSTQTDIEIRKWSKIWEALP